MHFVVLCPKVPEDSTGSAFGFNISEDGTTRQTGGTVLNSGPLGDIAKKGHNLVTKTDIRVQK